MRKQWIFILAVLCIANTYAQRQNATYLAYIEQWKEVAIQQQADYGIPASITMAQALLESGAGQSELATQANNHFGIKCTKEWFGGVYYHDDETEGECFRQYSDAAESFKDHSLFLQRSRYSTCFEIAPEDYEGWAQRLHQCGYATDKLYAQKLVKIIEDYRLDTLVAKMPKTETAQKKPLKATVVHQTDPIMVIHNDPEPPYVAPLTAREERDSFFCSHPKQKINGVPYVLAREGDTYSNVAFRLNVRERALREHNDALGRELAVDDRIYLRAKKKSAGTKDDPFVWTRPGLTLWQLCQNEGIQMQAVQKLNELDPSVRVFHIRQKIYLRKVKEDGNR